MLTTAGVTLSSTVAHSGSAVGAARAGWAQVMYRYGASVEETREKLCYDLYAIQELNPFLYGVILLKTVQTVLLKPGS